MKDAVKLMVKVFCRCLWHGEGRSRVAISPPRGVLRLWAHRAVESR